MDMFLLGVCAGVFASYVYWQLRIQLFYSLVHAQLIAFQQVLEMAQRDIVRAYIAKGEVQLTDPPKENRRG